MEIYGQCWPVLIPCSDAEFGHQFPKIFPKLTELAPNG